MNPLLIPPLITGGANLLGGLLSAGGAIGGALINSSASRDINSKNADLQKEFAQNSIQWKIADAKKAGIHPLYALGAQGYSASPSYVGYDKGAGIRDGAAALGSGIANAGRDALSVYLKSKEAKYNSRLMDLDIAEKELQIKLLKQKLDAAPSSSNKGSDIVPNAKSLLPPKSTGANINSVNEATNVGRTELKADINDVFKKSDPLMNGVHVGKGVLKFFFNDDVPQKEAMSEDSWVKHAMALWDAYGLFSHNNFDLVKQYEKLMHANGSLPKNMFLCLELTPWGVQLEPCSTRDYGRIFDDVVAPAVMAFREYAKKGGQAEREIRERRARYLRKFIAWVKNPPKRNKSMGRTGYDGP